MIRETGSSVLEILTREVDDSSAGNDYDGFDFCLQASMASSVRALFLPFLKH